MYLYFKFYIFVYDLGIGYCGWNIGSKGRAG